MQEYSVHRTQAQYKMTEKTNSGDPIVQNSVITYYISFVIHPKTNSKTTQLQIQIATN